MSSAHYRRILLKVSGEMLAGEQGYGVQPSILEGLAEEIADVVAMDVEVAVVIGGGNIFRGLAASARGMERASADYMGMLATVLNALALQNALEGKGVSTRVQSAIEMRQLAEGYIRRRAIRHLEKKARRDLRGRNGKSLFLHRYRGITAGDGNRRPGHHEGHQGRRYLRQRSGQESTSQEVCRDSVPVDSHPEPQGDGLHGHQLVHG
jgi:hypothetical protein